MTPPGMIWVVVYLLEDVVTVRPGAMQFPLIHSKPGRQTQVLLLMLKSFSLF
jgi:hypothetical protein